MSRLIFCLMIAGCTTQGQIGDTEGQIDGAGEVNDTSLPDGTRSDNALFLNFLTDLAPTGIINASPGDQDVAPMHFLLEDRNEEGMPSVTVTDTEVIVYVADGLSSPSGYRPGHAGNERASDFIASCQLKSWPDGAIDLGTATPDVDGNMPFSADFEFKAAEIIFDLENVDTAAEPLLGMVFKLTCGLTNVPPPDGASAISFDIRSSSQLSAVDEDGRPVPVQIGEINGEPPKTVLSLAE